MERDQIIEKIRTILVGILKHDNFQLKDDLSAAEVDGWDSLTHMMIITEIEATFGIKFRLKELNQLNNLGSLIALINLKLAQ